MANGKTLTVYLAADVDKLRRGLKDAEDGFTVFGRNVEGMIGPAIAGAVAGVGALATAMAVDGVKSAVSLGESLNKASVIFGESSGAITAFAENANLSLGQTQQQAIDAASTFATFGKSAGLSGDMLAAFSTKLVTLSADFASFNNTSPEQAIDAIGAALRGEAEPLRQFGVLLDDATLKARAMKMGIYDGNGALTSQQKVLAAYEEILGQSNDAQGDFERTQGSLSNQVKIASAAFDDFKTSIGKGFIKGLGDVGDTTNSLNKTLVDSQTQAEAGTYWFTVLGKSILQMWSNYAEQSGITAINKATVLLSDMGDTAENTANQVVDASILTSQALAGLVQMTDKYARGGYSGIPANKSFFTMDTWIEKIQKMKLGTKKQNDAVGGSGGLTSSIEKMNPKLRAQIDLVKDLTSELGKASDQLEAARKEMNDWIDSMAGQITSGIDLGAVYSAAFDEKGKSTGQSLIDGFNKQIQQAGIFGDYLKRLNSEGGPELRDAVAALGPEVGNKLAEEIIKGGLIPTMQSQLVAVKQQARTTASSMTPEFLVAGVNSAIQFLTGTQNALAAATSQLEEMGKAMGKTIGEAAAKEIADAIAAARGSQASATNTIAGTATGVGPTTAGAIAQSMYAGSPFLMGTATAQAIAQAIQDSNQRLGRTGQAVYS